MELGQLTAMKILSLADNKLTGGFLFVHRMSVVHTSLPNTNFRLRLCAGPIPTELGLLTAMKQLNFSYNQLTGRRLFAHRMSKVNESPKH